MWKKLLKKISGTETMIFDELSNLADEVYETVLTLENSIKDFLNNEDIKKDLAIVSKKEVECDLIVENLTKELFKGRLLPYSSEDWFDLINNIDELADLSDRATRLMSISKINLPEEVKEKTILLTKKTTNAVGLIKDSIHQLKKDFKLSREIAKRVGEVRDEVRNVEYEIYEKTHKLDIKTREIRLLKDVVFTITQIANKSKDISNRIVAMSIKYAF